MRRRNLLDAAGPGTLSASVSGPGELQLIIFRCLRKIDAADDLSQRKDTPRIDGKFINSHPQECLGKGGVRAKFSADADPAAVPVAGLDSHLDLLEHRRMVGVGEGFELRVLPVDRQCVLSQIVGTE